MLRDGNHSGIGGHLPPLCVAAVAVLLLPFGPSLSTAWQEANPSLQAVPTTGAFATDATKVGDSDGNKAEVAAIVKDTVSRVLVVLKNGELSRIEKRERVMKIIKPRVDFNLMARRTLHRKVWGAMTPEQRTSFTKLYIETIKRVYFEKLYIFADGAVEFSEPVARKTRKPAYSVVTHIVAKGRRIKMVYALTQTRAEDKKKNVWKVYDFEIEGVSLRSSYRSQYKDFLNAGTLADLLEVMQRKIDEAKKRESEEQPKKKDSSTA